MKHGLPGDTGKNTGLYMPKNAEVLKTARFILTPMNPLLLALHTFEWTRNKTLFQNIRASSAKSFRAWYRTLRKSGKKRNICRAIVVRETGQIIGIHFVAVEMSSGIAETAIIVGDMHWHGKGVHREVSAACIDDCFFRLELAKVRSRVVGRNIASIKNTLALGYRPEGIARGEFVGADGRRSDLIHFGIMRSEWLSARGHKNSTQTRR